MAKPRIFIFLPTFTPHDAVGNDALGMYRLLSEAGYETRLLATEIHPEYRGTATLVDVDDDCWLDPRAILIYHHAIFSERGEKLLRRTRNRVVIKYHNVTPPEFFAPYAEHYYLACMNGLEATRRLAGMHIDFVWGASHYNNLDFIRLGVPESRCRTLAPIHRVEDVAAAPLDAVASGVCRTREPKILFVGAFRPNKGHFKALDVFAAYRCRAGRRGRMYFVGNYDPALSGYMRELEMYARQLDLEDGLKFATSVSLQQLRSYYTAADVFLCVSEHEGFCVPLVEAMYFRVPIVAWAATAVGETCDGCGVVYPEFDAGTLAGAIDACVEDPVLARELAARGRRRYETAFSPDAIRARLLELVEEVERL